MRLCYELVNNYGVALLLFTIIVKLIMVPSSIKQQKSSARMARIAPKLEQIRKKYANDRQKLNEATVELYEQEKISQADSCLPMIVTWVILLAIIEVVYAPMTYISGLSKDKIDQAVHTVVDMYDISQQIYKDVPKTEGEEASNEKAVALTLSERLADGTNLEELLKGYNEKLSTKLKLNDERLSEITAIFEANPGIDEYFNDNKKVSSRLLNGGYTNRAQLIVLSIAKDYPQLFDSQLVEFCDDFDYTFLGLYLGRYPDWKQVTIIIPIVSLFSQMILMVISNFFMKRNGQAVQNNGMMGMLYVMPILSFIIAFSFPAGIGIYWIFSALVGLFETVLKNLYYTPERMKKILAKEDKKKARKPSLYQQMLQQQKLQNGTAGTDSPSLIDDLDEVKLTKSERKEVERQRINEARSKFEFDDEIDTDPRIIEARKRMAEKYGDEM